MDSAAEKPELKAAKPASMEPTSDVDEGSAIPITAGSQSLHRNLRGKEVQLFAIGGAIGTCESISPLNLCLLLILLDNLNFSIA